MKRFPFLEIGIAIAFAALLYILIYPQYKDIKANNIVYDLETNLYSVQAAVERYIAYNQGNIPHNADEFMRYKIKEVPIINPFTGEEITTSDFVYFKYDIPGENKSMEPKNTNGVQKGKPGQIGYGYFYLPEDSTKYIEYGLIVFDGEGKPLMMEDIAGSGRIEVFVLSGSLAP